MKVAFIHSQGKYLIAGVELPCLPPVNSLVKLIVKTKVETFKVDSEPVFLFNSENILMDIMVSLHPC